MSKQLNTTAAQTRAAQQARQAAAAASRAQAAADAKARRDQAAQAQLDKTNARRTQQQQAQADRRAQVAAQKQSKLDAAAAKVKARADAKQLIIDTKAQAVRDKYQFKLDELAARAQLQLAKNTRTKLNNFGGDDSSSPAEGAGLTGAGYAGGFPGGGSYGDAGGTSSNLGGLFPASSFTDADGRQVSVTAVGAEHRTRNLVVAAAIVGGGWYLATKGGKRPFKLKNLLGVVRHGK